MAPKRTSVVSRPELSLVVPAYNESARLLTFLEPARAYLLKEYGSSHEIIVADDGSTDNTAQLAGQLLGPNQVLSLSKNQGKGAAVRAGMLKARGHLRLFADADGATPIAEERRLMSAIRKGCDVAIGSRAAPGGRAQWQFRDNSAVNPASIYPGDTVSWRIRPHRLLSGRAFALSVQWILGLPYRDTQCGFKLFTEAATEALFSRARCNRFAFDVELLYLAARLQLRVAEVPVNWHEVSGTKVRLWHDAWQMLGELFRIRAFHSSLMPTSGSLEKQRESA